MLTILFYWHRILASLETFLDNLNVSTVSRNSANNQTVLNFETFAITVQDLDPDSFQGQTFVVDLGPVRGNEQYWCCWPRCFEDSEWLHGWYRIAGNFRVGANFRVFRGQSSQREN